MEDEEQHTLAGKMGVKCGYCGQLVLPISNHYMNAQRRKGSLEVLHQNQCFNFQGSYDGRIAAEAWQNQWNNTYKIKAMAS